MPTTTQASPTEVNHLPVLAASRLGDSPHVWAVLCWRRGEHDAFVVWTYRSDTKDAFWGHYVPTLPLAVVVFEAKGGKF